MIKTLSIVVLLITLFNFGSFAEEIQAFNFTKEEFDNLTVRKIKKNTKICEWVPYTTPVIA